MGKITFNYINPKGKLESYPSLEEVISASKKGGYFWIDIFEPSREILEPVARSLNFSELSIEDCIDENQIPKIDIFPEYTFILFNSFTVSKEDILIDELDFFIGHNFIVTVYGFNTGGRNPFEKLSDRLKTESENIRKGPDSLLHVLLDYIVDRKFEAINNIQDRIDEAEEKILDSTAFNLEELICMRRQLLSIRKSLFHEREIISRLSRRDSPVISEKTVFLFKDINDHIAKYFETIETCREILTSLMEIHLASLNTQMTAAANRTNDVVRRLTIITTIFMPLSFFAGVGGMSEWSMITGPENWYISYPVFMLLMFVIAVLNYYILKWGKWI